MYSGCSHECEYCYAMSYAQSKASCKRGFERMLERDLADLETFDVPPAPVHLSNSTDPFHPLEQVHSHTRLALEGILEHRHRFTTVTMLTKNPLLPVKLGYLDLFQSLGRISPDHPKQAEVSPPFQVQVSLAFWRDEGSVFSLEELAKHFEHRVRDLEEAMKWTRSALELAKSSELPAYVKKHWKQELDHRLARLKTKSASRK